VTQPFNFLDVMSKLALQLPSQGWQQVLTARSELLDAYDRARTKARAHETETYHGRAAEAELRRWLSEFLPKRYGITSGYIISPGVASDERAPHFDVVIYDQLESPVLWIEDHSDVSHQGRSRAIPVEYVQCVLEVKASFSADTVRDAVNHLRDLTPLMLGQDAPDERYKMHLPPQFSCGLVFFELRTKHARSEAALRAVADAGTLRGFYGGTILRAEGHTKPLTGKLRLYISDTPVESSVQRGGPPLTEFALSRTTPTAEGQHLGVDVFWSEMAFSEFAFDLIALMKGIYRINRVSSWYGQGSSQLEELKALRNTKNDVL
jgi:hypothetical protein